MYLASLEPTSEGVFLQPDPINIAERFEMGYLEPLESRYAYGDPINFIDPDGAAATRVGSAFRPFDQEGGGGGGFGGGGGIVVPTVVSAGIAAAWNWVFSKPGFEDGPNANKTVEQILKGKKGSIRRAPLPPGSPSWDSLIKGAITWEEIVRRSRGGSTGYQTIKKLLSDQRFNR